MFQPLPFPTAQGCCLVYSIIKISNNREILSWFWLRRGLGKPPGLAYGTHLLTSSTRGLVIFLPSLSTTLSIWFKITKNSFQPPPINKVDMSHPMRNALQNSPVGQLDLACSAWGGRTLPKHAVHTRSRHFSGVPSTTSPSTHYPQSSPLSRFLFRYWPSCSPSPVEFIHGIYALSFSQAQYIKPLSL